MRFPYFPLTLSLLQIILVTGYAQPNSADCRKYTTLVASLQNQEQAALDRLDGEACQGRARTGCLQRVKQLQDQIRTNTAQKRVVCDPKFKPKPPLPPYTRAPFDLISDSVDPNGFPLNPRWGRQDRYMLETGSHDLWVPQARPHIYNDCLLVARRQTVIGVGNDYNPFSDGYCRNSTGATSYNPDYCHDLPHAPFQPGGAIYCSSWSWKDEPFAFKCLTSPFNIPYHIEGHLNFTVATYDGILRWDNAQAEYNFDYDWCMNLYTPHGAGVSGLQADESWIHAEVNPKDFADGFDRGFWKTFRDNIQAGYQYCGDLQYCSGTTDNQNKTVAPMINGKRAIVIGLMGLDMGHDDAGAELHPIYGLAIHTGGRALKGSECNWTTGHCTWDDSVYNKPELDPVFDVPENVNDDTWAIWVANYGSEGYCSTGALHMLDGAESIIGRASLPTMSFSLPWAKDESGQPMADADLLPNTNFALHAEKKVGSTDAIFDVAITRGANIAITFHMLPGEAKPYWFGELHLKWKRASNSIITALPPRTLAPARAATMPAPAESEEHPTMAKMNEAQKAAFLAAMTNASKTPPLAEEVSIIGTPGTAPPPPAKPIQPRAHSSGKAFSRGGPEENADTKRALCAAYGGKVPDVPADFCQQTSR